MAGSSSRVSGMELAGLGVAVLLVGIILSSAGLIYPLLIIAAFAVLVGFLLTAAKIDFEGGEADLERKHGKKPDEEGEEEKPLRGSDSRAGGREP